MYFITKPTHYPNHLHYFLKKQSKMQSEIFLSVIFMTF